MTHKNITKAELANFTGSEQWYRHGLAKNVLYTDGAKYVADSCGAYWLIDEIAFSQMEAKIRIEEFQLWCLKVTHKHSATLICEDGNGREVYRKLIEFTDFPLSDIKFYFTDNVIMLTSEY